MMIVIYNCNHLTFHLNPEHKIHKAELETTEHQQLGRSQEQTARRSRGDQSHCCGVAQHRLHFQPASIDCHADTEPDKWLHTQALQHTIIGKKKQIGCYMHSISLNPY